MGSDEATKRKYEYINKYKKEHCKRIDLTFRKDYYNEQVAPAAQAKGMSVTAYVKEAIAEKISRMHGGNSDGF